jgi:hypothetical protein
MKGLDFNYQIISDNTSIHCSLVLRFWFCFLIIICVLSIENWDYFNKQTYKHCI